MLFSRLDEVTKPENKGLRQFYHGLTDDKLNLFRRRCLDVTGEEVLDVCKRYLMDRLEKDETSKVIFGSKDNNLEGIVSRGWKVDKFANDLSFNESNYDN